jgi:uncharacterized protein (DUF1330 family)
MSAYIILDIEVTDPVTYDEYKKLAAPTVADYGGRYLVRGGAAESLEGDWQPRRIVVLEFASVERARQWLDSPEYAGPRAMRHRAAHTRAILVEGAPPP